MEENNKRGELETDQQHVIDLWEIDSRNKKLVQPRIR